MWCCLAKARLRSVTRSLPGPDPSRAHPPVLSDTALSQSSPSPYRQVYSTKECDRKSPPFGSLHFTSSLILVASGLQTRQARQVGPSWPGQTGLQCRLLARPWFLAGVKLIYERVESQQRRRVLESGVQRRVNQTRLFQGKEMGESSRLTMLCKLIKYHQSVKGS
jgi:hypothetical protein